MNCFSDEIIEKILEISFINSKFLLDSQILGEYISSNKVDGSLVTSVDLRAQTLLIEWLRNLGFNKFISEEFDFENCKNSIDFRNSFIIDPLDGTSSFAQGGDFSFNIAFVNNEYKAIFGLIAEPRLSRVTFISQNKSFFVYDGNFKQNHWQEVEVREDKDLTIITSKSNNKLPDVDIKKIFDGNNVIRKTASTKYIDFIENKNSLVFINHRLAIWDFIPIMALNDVFAVEFNDEEFKSFDEIKLLNGKIFYNKIMIKRINKRT